MIYLDYSATTPVLESVLDSYIKVTRDFIGNANSIHTLGVKSKELMMKATKQISECLNCSFREIIYTSGASESNSTAILGVARKYSNRGKHIITSKLEHKSVLETMSYLESIGYEISYCPLNKDGSLNMNELEKLIREDTILVSIMSANNEIGTIEPIKEIGEICKKHNVLFHTDAVQAYSNMKIDVKEMNIDLLSTSAHKLHGPKGIGFLYVRKGLMISPLIHGGMQEKGKRAGTTNAPLIMGFKKAVELKFENMDKNNEYVTNLRNYLMNRIENEIPYAKLNGSKEHRLPGNVNFSFRFIEGEGMLLRLDAKGICASSGSACTSGSLDPSHVLLAIGLPHEIAHGSLRISINEENTKEEIDYLVDNLKEIIEYLRNMSPLYEDFIKKEGK